MKNIDYWICEKMISLKAKGKESYTETVSYDL